MSRLMVALMKLLGRMPFWFLYGVANVIFVLACYVVRYRRRLVMRNISLCFPDMERSGVCRTARRFYRHLADYFVETVKLAHISDDEMRRRMEFVNLEAIDGCLDRGQSVAVYFSHCFNWEWAPSITLFSRHASDSEVIYAQVYRPLTNEAFDRLFLRLRSRFHSVSIAKRSTFRDLLKLRHDGKMTVTGFMSDQKPSHLDPVHEVNFLGRPTLVITGTETLARKMNLACVYWDMERTGRGHYRLTVRKITDNPGEEPANYITDTYARMLGETLRRDPSNWLWTHNRWKNIIINQNHHV